MTDAAALHAAVTVDVGTGDGRFVLARAAAAPGELVIGLDASAAAMTESSRRAARAAARGGLANARFVVAALESLPAELAALADLVTVQFPWGSLLRAAVASDPGGAERLAALLKPHGTLRLLVSASRRDNGNGLDAIDPAAVAAAWRRHGLRVLACRPATVDDITASRSTWAKRLRHDPHRSIWLFELVKPL